MKHSYSYLEKRYLYLPSICRVNKQSQNIYDRIRQVGNKSILEEVSVFDKDIYSSKKELFKIKLEAMKNFILNNKPIPEKWIFKHDYNRLLQKAMSDPIVLQYAIINANHLRNQVCPEHIPRQSNTIPQKRHIISNPQIYFSNRRKNPMVKHINKFRKNNSEQSMVYNNSQEDNNYINKLKLKHNKSQDFDIKNKNTYFLLTSIAEKELELPLI